MRSNLEVADQGRLNSTDARKEYMNRRAGMKSAMQKSRDKEFVNKNDQCVQSHGECQGDDDSELVDMLHIIDMKLK